MADLTAEEKIQAVREKWLNLEATTDPITLRRFFTSNIIQRVFAQLVGRGETSAVPILATEAGLLRVAAIPGGFSHNDSTYVAAVADAFATFQFADICSRVDIWCWTNGVTIGRRSTAVASFEDDIRVDANQFYSFDCDCDAIRHKNTTPGSAAAIQIVGWY
jgi:hypothetical protein